MKSPIFILFTRSFWLGIFPAVLTAFDLAVSSLSQPGASGPVSEMLSWGLTPLTGWTGQQIEHVMLTLLPVYTLVVAHQRRGDNRPYTVNPKAK